jgi:acid stress chaperone HdeB
MRCRALFVVILIGAASSPAAAQIKLDMNKVTCGDWLGYSPADRNFVRYFMSGYYSAAAKNNVRRQYLATAGEYSAHRAVH